MSEEISSDVEYLINQFNQIKNNQTKMKIVYNNEEINGQNCLTKEDTISEPIIEINKQFNDKTYFTLVMIDPDAPSSDKPITGPFIHWIKANFKQSNGNDGQNICEYRGPGPRPGTGQHRYIFLLYQSNEQVKEDKTFEDIPQRRKFPLAKFVSDNQLELIGGTLFIVHASD